MSVSAAPSLGLQLVDMLTQQLRGRLELDRNGGTTFRITFTDRQRTASKKRDQ